MIKRQSVNKKQASSQASSQSSSKAGAPIRQVTLEDYAPEAGSAREDEFISYQEITGFVHEYMRTIAIATGVTIALALLYVMTATPIFTAEGRLLLDPTLNQERPAQSGELRVSIDSPYLQSQIVVLLSEKILNKVIDRLGLLKVDEFRVSPPSFFRRMKAKLFGGARGKQTSFMDFVDRRVAIGKLKAGLQVRRVGLPHAIDIGFSSRNPDMSARVVNAVIDAYIAYRLETKEETAREGGQWLEKRIDELRILMNSSARKVQRFKAALDFRISGVAVEIAETPDRDADKGGADKGGQKGAGDARGKKGAKTVVKKRRVSLEELESEAKTYRRLYESFLLAYTEAVQRQSNPFSNARVITKAERPLSKSRPRSKLVLILGAVVGLLQGVGIALMRRVSDGSVRSRAEMESRLEVECLALVPAAPEGGESVELDQYSGFSNSIKSLRMTLRRRRRNREALVLGFLSARSEPQCSNIIHSLAGLLVDLGEKAIVIDADLLNRTISDRYAVQCKYGAVDVLEDECELEEAIVPGGEGMADLLPATSNNERLGGYELLSSDKMQALLELLRRRYDYVLVDLPPLRPVIETAVISALLDEVIVTAEHRHTPLEALLELKQVAHSAKVNLVGSVLANLPR